MECVFSLGEGIRMIFMESRFYANRGTMDVVCFDPRDMDPAVGQHKQGDNIYDPWFFASSNHGRIFCVWDKEGL